MTDPDQREAAVPSADRGTGIAVVDGGADHDDALAVRYAVFVEGQGVPEELEVDEHEDAAGVVHFTAYDDGEAIGAARLRPYQVYGHGEANGRDGTGAHDGTNPRDETGSPTRRAKVERVAVVESRRGEGWGARLMDAVEDEARARGFDGIVLHAQTHVEGFYADRGYETVGEEFEEAGIPHVEMRLSLD
jgi:predicted GNAT family N-acyltransferase